MSEQSVSGEVTTLSPRKGSMITVFLVVLIDLLGFGIVLPLLPFYAQNFNAGPVIIGLLYSVYSFSQLIFSPIWGSYSDKFGRRPIMLLSTFGAVMAYILFGLADSLLVLFLSRILAGVMGGNIATAQAYISDITDKSNRARGMGVLGAAFGLGFVFGPAMATGLINETFQQFVAQSISADFGAWMLNNRYGLPGFFAAFLSFTSFLMVMFKLPETVDKEHPEEHSQKRLSVFTPAFWKELSGSADTNKKGLLLPLLSGSFLLSFGESTLYSAFPLFCEKVLGMSAEQVGIQFFYIGVIAVIVQGGLIRPLTKRFGEKNLFLTGSVFVIVGLASIPFSGSIAMLSVFLGIMAVGKSLNTPTIFSLVSQQASEQNYGRVLGTNQGLSGMGRVIGPSWGGLLFGFFYWLPFVATGTILLLTVFIGILIKRRDL
jgi:MFS family permease